LVLKSTRLRLAAIYTAGNAWANPGSTVRNFCNLLYLHGVTDVPVLIGSHVALSDERDANGTGLGPRLRYRDTIPVGPDGFLYADTVWGAAHLLPQSFRAYDVEGTPDTDDQSIPALLAVLAALPIGRRIEWLSVGTLTMVAKLFRPPYAAALAPLLPRIQSLTIMGGAVDVAGNLFSLPNNTVAEFNMYNDPLGAHVGMAAAAAAGIPVRLVPLDATSDAPIARALLAALRDAPATPEAQFVGVVMEKLRRTWFDPPSFFSTAYLWDPTAAIVLHAPWVVTNASVTQVKVVDDGPRGDLTGWTKRCDAAEVAAGECFPSVVVYDVNGGAVNKQVERLLQAPVNAAVRSLLCWAEMPGGPLVTPTDTNVVEQGRGE